MIAAGFTASFPRAIARPCHNASIDSAEQVLDSSRRIRVKGIRPVTDAAACYGSISYRETPQATAAYMRAEVERWRKVIKAANVKLE